MKSTAIRSGASLVLSSVLFGCQPGPESPPTPPPATAPSPPATAPALKRLPAAATVAALRDLPAGAALKDVLQITGEPSGDIGSAIHDYFFILDDQTSLRIRAKLNGELISVQHNNAELLRDPPRSR